MKNIMTICMSKNKQGLQGNGYIRSETKRIPCSTSNLKMPKVSIFTSKMATSIMSEPWCPWCKLKDLPSLGNLTLNRKPKHNRTSWNVANFLAHHETSRICFSFPKAFRAARHARAVGRPAAATKIISSWGSWKSISPGNDKGLGIPFLGCTWCPQSSTALKINEQWQKTKFLNSSAKHVHDNLMLQNSRMSWVGWNSFLAK